MAYLRTRINELLGIEHPVIQDGMGPFNTVKLAAAVSNAGGLGSVSMPTLVGDPADGAKTLRSHLEEAASLTEGPYAVNIGVGVDKESGQVLPVSEAMVNAVLEAVANDQMVAARLGVITTSGGFPGMFVDGIREAGLFHMHKVGATRQAVKAAEAGVGAIIASGYEMGGHTHHNPVHTFVLVPNVVKAVDVPVVLAGGGRDGRTLAAALALGAEGLAMGTRFIVTEENDWHNAYKQRIVDAGEGEDLTFPAFYGPARGLKGPGIDRLLEITNSKELTGDDLREWKNEALTRAQRDGDIASGVVAAGQVSSAIESEVKISEFVPGICREAAEIISGLPSVLADSSASTMS